jgi:soluble lytic murein transglycosylase
MRALAARNRFDLILAQVDPEKEEESFLRAAHLAGQQDLVARYQALEGRCSPETVPFLFPLRLAPVVARLIREEGLAGAVDPAFVLAMIKNESIFQPGARSGASAYGIMQLLKPTFTRMAGRSADILDPETNIRAGLRYYKTIIKTAQLESLPEEVRMLYILAGYHAGEGRARRWRRTTEEKLQGRTSPVEVMLRIEAVPISSTRYYIMRALGDRELFRHFLD